MGGARCLHDTGVQKLTLNMLCPFLTSPGEGRPQHYITVAVFLRVSKYSLFFAASFYIDFWDISITGSDGRSAPLRQLNRFTNLLDSYASKTSLLVGFQMGVNWCFSTTFLSMEPVLWITGRLKVEKHQFTPPCFHDVYYPRPATPPLPELGKFFGTSDLVTSNHLHLNWTFSWRTFFCTSDSGTLNYPQLATNLEH